MRVQSGETDAPSSQPRSKPHTPNGAPAPLPDLFGFVPEAAPAWPTKPTKGPAEWPAAGASRTPRVAPVYAAPDRPAAGPLRPASGLAGDYERHGANLRRPDGRCLVLCLSTKPTTARRPARYVRTVAPGEAIRYAGSLYADDATGADDLDGTQFQDRATRVRYCIRRTAPDRYRVEPTRRRGRKGR